MDMSTEIIAIDHGWSQIKTPTFIFTTGVKKIRNKPAFMNDVLEYNGSYYKIGTERMEVKDNKFETQDFYLLTLAAIAKELSLRNRRNAEVLLAVGLPLTRFGEERKPFIDYLMKNKDVKFVFEEKEYSIRISRVCVYPQCYAAIADMIPVFQRKVIVVDIGSWTLDILPVVDKKPDDTAGSTLPQGLITCMRDINKKISTEFHYELDEMDIANYMMGRQVSLDSKIIQIMDEEIRAYAEMVLHSLTEMKINIKTTPIIFVGGGAILMKNFGPTGYKNITYKTDVKANAKGYESLAMIGLSSGR